MAHDDNLKLNDHTHAEHLVIYMLGLNAHPIMFKEMWDNVVFSNAVVKDVDIVGYWNHSIPNQNDGWGRIKSGAIACLQTRNVTIENALFRDIRIESPHLSRVFSFYNLYSEGTDWPYVPDWLDIDNRSSHSSIHGLTFENINVDSPLIGWRSLLGSGFADSFGNVSFANLVINGVTVTEANKNDYFEISGYRNGTDPGDGGSGRIVIANPVQNLTFHDTPYEAWEYKYALIQGPSGDDDGDGHSNSYEFVAGLNPTDANSVFTLMLAPIADLPGQWAISFSPIVSDRTYTVMTSDSLAAGSWTPLIGGTLIDAGTPPNIVRTITDTGATGPIKFYRVEITYP